MNVPGTLMVIWRRSACPERREAGSASLAVAGSVVALLAARNVTEVVLPDPAYVPANVALGAVLVAVARRAGSSWEDLGLARRHVRPGVAVGAVAASAAVAGMVVAAALPFTRGLFDDERVPADASGGERLYQTALRIPIGTAAFEELAFRGVLLALLRRRLPTGAAVAIDSALFGLWHIVPTLATARANGIVGAGRVGLVVGSVAATAVGGAVFCALRLRGRHLLAPALLHVAFNDTGYLLAWWLRR
ncbi:MAG TPA: CPBP family intramembrane glutamic endopeptidase [Acidimicrobiales bacterium]|nr:CPBP family intramembrane glutamic endopeptidase [Acidimicrobiales bacterium]